MTAMTTSGQRHKQSGTVLLTAGLMVIGMSATSFGGQSGVYNDGHTTIVRNGNSIAIVTQSGDPSKAEVRVTKEPGRTTIYRRNGNSTSVVTQSTRPADIPPESLPPWLRKMLRP